MMRKGEQAEEYKVPLKMPGTDQALHLKVILGNEFPN
jgi:hypothetical protein